MRLLIGVVRRAYQRADRMAARGEQALANNQPRDAALAFREARWLLRFNRFFPRFVDWVTKRKVRSLFPEEIAARRYASAIEAVKLLLNPDRETVS